MNSTGSAKLKHRSGWYAAGRELSRAMSLLSDGAFKQLVYVCLRADRKTGRCTLDEPQMARALGKSASEIKIYFEELLRLQVCQLLPVDHNARLQIEICDAFWPYEKIPASEPMKDLMAYTDHVRRMMTSRRCIVASFSAADEKLASILFNRKISIVQIERGFLLGCARKYASLLNGQSLEMIVSFHYFQNIIDEVVNEQVSDSYWSYLRVRLDRMEVQWMQRCSSAQG